MNIHQACQILGVQHNDPNIQTLAKKAFRDLSKRYHPDKNNGTDTTAQFNDVQEAYAEIKNYLKNPQVAIPFQIQQAAQILQIDPLSANLEDDARAKFNFFEQQYHPVQTGNIHMCDRYIQCVQAYCLIIDYIRHPQNYVVQHVNLGQGVRQTVDQHGNVRVEIVM